MHRLIRSVSTVACVALCAATALAAEGVTAGKPAPAHKAVAKKPPRNKYGSPLDTLRESHLTTTVPEAEGFVRDTRPPMKDLNYTPLTGQDPDRPKPRDKANVAALQAEMEQAAAAVRTRAQPSRPGRSGRKKDLNAARD